MVEAFLKKIMGSLKLYWQHICLAVSVLTWCFYVAPKASTYDNIQSAWSSLVTVIVLLAFGYSAARLIERRNGKKNGG